MAATIIITPPDSGSLGKALQPLSATRFSWVYLGQNVARFHRLEELFKERGTCIDIAQRFHQTSETLRDHYLAFTYELVRSQQSMKWWTTALAYRNGYVSKAFHHICYLRIALELAGSWGPDEPLVLVADGPVCQAIEENLSQRKQTGFRVIQRPLSPLIDWAKNAVKAVTHRGHFLVHSSYRKFKSRRVGPARVVPGQATTVLISWLTVANLHLGARFHESYFGDLAHRLGQRGVKVAVLPMILRDVDFQEALSGLDDATLPVLLPHQQLAYWDVIWAAVSSSAKPKLPRAVARLDGMDVRTLVKHDLDSHWADNSSADALLMAALVRRWSKLGLDIQSVIYVFENQPWERALCWEARRVFPEARLVGYQHARAPRMGLNWYLAPGGEPDAPLPHRVATVGRYNARILSEAGYPPGCVRVGGAIQLQNFMKQMTQQATRQTDHETGRTVLVAPAHGIEEASALVDMAINLFDEHDGVSVVLKFHPLLPAQKIIDYLGVRLPGHVEVSEEPITDLMQRSSLMVYTSSLVCVQALALDLPVIKVTNQFDLDTDPLETVPELRLEAASLAELREKVSWLLDHREEYISRHSQEWKSAVEDIYSPVTEETVDAFVD